MTQGFGTDGQILEGTFQAQVEGLARLYGWKVYHAPDNKPRAGARGRAGRQRVERGFPDLVAARDAELVIAELKRHNGRLSREQEEWLEAFRTVGHAIAAAVSVVEDTYGDVADGAEPHLDVYVWRPVDWPDIEQRLSRGRPRVGYAVQADHL